MKNIMKKHGYVGLEPDWHILGSAYWEYDYENKKWVDTHDLDYCVGYSMVPTHSIKAAMRHIKKHDEIPVGMKFRLVNWYVGEPDIIITKKAKYKR